MKIDDDMSLLTHDELLVLSKKYDFTDPEYMRISNINIQELIF